MKYELMERIELIGSGIMYTLIVALFLAMIGTAVYIVASIPVFFIQVALTTMFAIAVFGLAFYAVGVAMRNEKEIY